jgi:hypothetical protein
MTPRLPSPLSLRIVAATTVAGLALAGCNDSTPEQDPAPGDSGSTSPSASGSPTESPTADVSVPEEVSVTAQGTNLSFGDTATVVFEPDQKRASLLELTVKSARKGRLDDFKSYVLDDPYKRKASYYYVRVAVENVGTENVGGAPVPLWGVNDENTLLPVVNFTTDFKPCASTPLPEKFKPGKRLDTCLVYLAPERGKLEAVSFRPDQAFDPIEWTGEVKPPKAEKKPKKKSRDKNS